MNFDDFSNNDQFYFHTCLFLSNFNISTRKYAKKDVQKSFKYFINTSFNKIPKLTEKNINRKMLLLSNQLQASSLNYMIQKQYPIYMLIDSGTNYEKMPALDISDLKEYAIFSLKCLDFLIKHEQLLSALTDGTNKLCDINQLFMKQFCMFISIKKTDIITITIHIIMCIQSKYPEILALYANDIIQAFTLMIDDALELDKNLIQNFKSLLENL